MTIFIADLSHYQAPLTIQQLKDAGMSAVILKSSEGASYRDPSFTGWLAQAKLLGMPVAAYHFVHPGGWDAQVRNVASMVPKDVPVWWDCEAGATRDDGYACASRWSAVGGVTAGIYHGAQPRAPFGWWRAAYLSDPTGAPAATYARQGGDQAGSWLPGVDLWQFCQHGTIPGFSGTVDFSAYRGTVAQLLSHGWFHHSAIEPVTITKEEDMRLHQDSAGNVWAIGTDRVLFAAAGDAAGHADAQAWSTWTGLPILPVNPQFLARIPVKAPATVDVTALEQQLVADLAAHLPGGTVDAAELAAKLAPGVVQALAVQLAKP